MLHKSRASAYSSVLRLRISAIITEYLSVFLPLRGVTTTDEDIDVFGRKNWLAFPIIQFFILNRIET